MQNLISTPLSTRCRTTNGLHSLLQIAATAGFFCGILFGAHFGIRSVEALEVGALENDNASTTDATNSAALARISDDLKFLSDDERQGRAAETPGLRQAAVYIATRFSELQLRTDLFDGKPFQNFKLDGKIGAPASLNRLELRESQKELQNLKLDEDYRPISLGKNGEVEGEVVFVGYGITSSEDVMYDDYAGIDVQGKIVIALRKEPQANDPDSPFDGASPSQHALFTTKEINAAQHGAVAMILVNDAASEESAPGSLLPIETSGGVLKDKIPTFYMRRAILDELMTQRGKSLKDIESSIDRHLKPQSFLMQDLRISGKATIETNKIDSFNVLGLLSGSGALADEYIVLGAHFDHVGMGGEGSLAPGTIEVHNGADDNGSGTVSLLEAAHRLAAYYKANPARPKRNILFIAFSGEERGLLGSQYYCKHPRFELEKTVAMLNMDMVGRLTNNELTIYGTGTATQFDSMITQVNEKLAFTIVRQPEGMGPSDHQSFFMEDIPVLHFFTGLHSDYHRPSDDFDKINLNGIVRITDMVSQLAEQLSVSDEKLTFVKVRGMAMPQEPRTRTLRLGVRLNDSTVERVLPNSLAQKAGIREGDKILAIGETTVAGRRDIEAAVRAFKPGDELSIRLERNGEKVELKVTIDK